MTQEKNTTAFTLSIIALATSAFLWLIIPGIITIVGWTKLKYVDKEYHKASRIMLIITTAWLGLKLILLPLLIIVAFAMASA